MANDELGAVRKATCRICPHTCKIADGELGFCHARRAEDGKVVDDSYGRITAINFDPIDKKPLYRFHRGSSILSISSYGCNMRCPWCHNHEISTAEVDDINWRFFSPEEIVAKAVELHDRGRGNIGLAYTYNEPLMNFEFVRDCSELIHEQRLYNVLVSNGMINHGPLSELLPLIDAANIDLKCFTEEGYKKLQGDLRSVKKTIEEMAASPTCHLEVTTLIVPGFNDNPEEIEAIAEWLASLDPKIVYHVTRFFPSHKLTNVNPTSIATINRLVREAHKHLRFVYAGNV